MDRAARRPDRQRKEGEPTAAVTMRLRSAGGGYIRLSCNPGRVDPQPTNPAAAERPEHPTAHLPELTNRTEQLLEPQLLYMVPCSVGATCAIGQRIHLLFPNSSPTLATICPLQPSTYHPLSIASVCRSTE